MAPIKSFSIIPRNLFFIFILFFFYGCAVIGPLPYSMEENNIFVAVNYKWISKFGKKTISEGKATPVLKNIITNKRYKPDYVDKRFTYFAKLEKGTYILEKILLDAGQVVLTIHLRDNSRAFALDEPGVYFMDGMDVIDKQTKIEYRAHDEIENTQNMKLLKEILINEVGFSPDFEVKRIEFMQIRK